MSVAEQPSKATPYMPVVRGPRGGLAGGLAVKQGLADPGHWFVTQTVPPSKIERYIDGPFLTQREAEQARRDWHQGLRGRGAR